MSVYKIDRSGLTDMVYASLVASNATNKNHAPSHNDVKNILSFIKDFATSKVARLRTARTRTTSGGKVLPALSLHIPGIGRFGVRIADPDTLRRNPRTGEMVKPAIGLRLTARHTTNYAYAFNHKDDAPSGKKRGRKPGSKNASNGSSPNASKQSYTQKPVKADRQVLAEA